MATLYLPDRKARRPVPQACSTPTRLVVDSGTRPVVAAHVDGVEVAMLVHSNAGFDAMLTHDAVRRVGGRSVAKEREFGLADDLSLSDAGRGRTRVDSLEVAGSVLRDLGVEVFDLPTIHWEGMLGVGWLSRVHAIVDFGAGRLVVPEGAALRETLLGPLTGSAVPLSWDVAAGRFVVQVEIGGVAGRFVVSTVAGLTLDLAYAQACGVEVSDPVGEEHGPSGAVIPFHRTLGPVGVDAGAVELPATTAEVYDLCAYMGAERRVEDPVDGHLGADVLVACGAVVDFGG